jgi:hypothetical protein
MLPPYTFKVIDMGEKLDKRNQTMLNQMKIDGRRSLIDLIVNDRKRRRDLKEEFYGDSGGEMSEDEFDSDGVAHRKKPETKEERERREKLTKLKEKKRLKELKSAAGGGLSNAEAVAVIKAENNSSRVLGRDDENLSISENAKMRSKLKQTHREKNNFLHSSLKTNELMDLPGNLYEFQKQEKVFQNRT